MSLPDELRTLAELRQQGRLTDLEFADAKRKLLGSAVDGGPGRPPKSGAGAADDGSETADEFFWSSRWSKGNHFFPDRILLSRDGIGFRKGALFGSTEEHINYRAVASFKVRNGIFLATISIETSGGSQPIVVNGLWKSDAKAIQEKIRDCQQAA